MAEPSNMTESPYVAEVSGADFAARVIEKSHETPVLVDFWAPWCAPCRMLTPILEGLANEYAGKLFVAKVNTDIEQELALEHRIRGIPAVKLFRNGQVVDEFVGVQPEPAIRALVDRFVPGEIDALIDRALALEKTGQSAEPAALLRQALDREPGNDRAKIALARLLCGHLPGDDIHTRLEECQALLDSVSIRSSADPDAEAVRARLNLWRAVDGAPSTQELERAVTTNPDDHAARYRLATRLALAGQYEPALEHLLEIVRRDRRFGDDAARKAMLGVFSLLGNQHPLANKYRALLSHALN